MESASVAAQEGKIGDPAEAARRFYDAWKRGNRSAAGEVAEPKAVDKLFSLRFMEMTFEACRNRHESYSCVYYNPRLDLRMSIEVSGGASAGYHVRWVTFSSEG